jgi:hypothetical protein
MQTVILTMPLATWAGSLKEHDALRTLEECIQPLVEQVGGYLDGHDFGAGDMNVWLYGPDADALFDAVWSGLVGTEVPPGSSALKRYGVGYDDPTLKKEPVLLRPGADTAQFVFTADAREHVLLLPSEEQRGPREQSRKRR